MKSLASPIRAGRLAALVFAVLACLGVFSSAALADGVISGTVTDASTTAAAPGITVDLFDSDNNFVAETTTATDGTYKLPSEPAGAYEVEFSGEDYEAQFYNGQGSLGTANRITIGSSDVGGIDAALQPAGQITGTVTDTSANPIDNAEVDVYASDAPGSQPINSTCTASDGTYTLSGLAGGTYYVGFNNGCGAGDYAPEFYNQRSSLRSSDPVTVTLGATSSGINASLPAEGGIAGTVTDTASNPLTGVEVDVYDSNAAGSTPISSTCTASDGSYALSGLASGTYYVGFSSACGAGNYAPQFYNGGSSLASAAPVSVTNGQTTSPIDAALGTGGAITGTVSDTSDNPVQNIEVDLYASSGKGSTPISSTCTAGDGTYTLSGLASGTYYVGFTSGCGAGNYAPQFYNGKASLASADPVPVTAGQTTSLVNTTVATGGQISGTASDTAGNPLQNVEVDLYASNASGSRPISSICTVADGTYTLSNLPSGTYYVGFTSGCGAGNYTSQFYSGESSLADADPVTVTAGQTTSGVDARLQGSGQITGTVTDSSSGGPVGDVEVDVYASNSSGGKPISSTCTASDGGYTVSGLTTGTYYVGFGSGCGVNTYAPQFYNGELSLASAAPVTVSSGQTTSGIDAALQPAGQITGTATDGAGNPLAHVKVEVYDSNTPGSQPIGSTCTAADGTYTLPGLASGTYYVGFSSACGAGNYAPQFYNGEASLATADPVTVNAGQATSGIDATLAAGGGISGTITDLTTSKPIPDAEVDIYRSNTSGSTAILTACTAPDGTYAVSGLASGTYYVGFNQGDGGCGAENYAPQFYSGEASLTSADPVTVTAPNTTPAIDAALSPGGQITGTVKDASSSKALAGVEVAAYDSNSAGSPPVSSTCTVSDGTYGLTDLPSGTYYLAFSGGCGAGNYAPQYYNAKPTLSSSDPVTVTAGQTTSGINAALSGGGQIAGTVTDATTGHPVGSVEVDIYSSNSSGSAPISSTCTAPDGTYTVSGLATASYYVGFNGGCGASQYAPEFSNDESSLASADAVAVTAGRTTASVDAALTVGGEITGTVTDSSGNPLAGVEVDLYSSNAQGSQPITSTCTAPDGTYTLSGLVSGSYYIGFNNGCGAGNFVPQFDNGETSLASADAVNVTLGQPTSGIDASLQDGGQITGTVTDAARSKAVGNVEVEAYASNSAGSAPVGQTCTSADGTYTLSGLPAGTYYVGFDVHILCGASGYQAQYSQDEASLATADPVTVAAGATVGSIDAALQPATQLTGRVTDATTDAPLAGVEVDVYSSNAAGSNPVRSTCTGTDGRYLVQGLAAGNYYVGFGEAATGQCTASAYVAQFYDNQASLDSSDPVTIDAGATTGSINAALEPQHPAERLTVALAGAGNGTVTGGSISCPGACSETVAQGTQVVLTAQPATGSVFSGWSGGGCSTSATCDVRVTAATTVTATFAAAPSSPQAPPAAGNAPTSTSTTTGAPGATHATLPPTQSVGPASATVLAALSRVLAPSGKAAKISALLKSGGYAFRFASPGGGGLVMRWYATAHGKRVLIASGTAVLLKATKATVRIRLTPAGKRLLRGLTRVRVTAAATFTPRGSQAVNATKAFSLS